MNDARLGREIRAALLAESGQRINADQAWGRFQRHRQQASRQRRRLLAVAAAAVVVAAAVRLDAAGQPGRPPGRAGPAAGQSPSGPAAGPLAPGLAPAADAVAARLPIGGVISMASDGPDVWAVTGSGELVRIDARTNAVTLRSRLTGFPNGGSLVAGGGALWLAGSGASGRGQVVRIDPATGAMSAQVTVPGDCHQLAYGPGYLWVSCDSASTYQVLQVDPATARVDARTRTLPGTVNSLVAGPGGAWYDTGAGFMRVSPGGARVTSVKITGPPGLNLMGPSVSYLGSLDSAQLMLASGQIWALASDESIAAISPATGRVGRAFNYLGYDPGYNFGGSLFATVGQGSVWLLAPVGRNEIIRVSMRTGQAVSLAYPGGSCGQPCWQVYDAAGAVWVPTSEQILRIDPARMPG